MRWLWRGHLGVIHRPLKWWESTIPSLWQASTWGRADAGALHLSSAAGEGSPLRTKTELPAPHKCHTEFHSPVIPEAELQTREISRTQTRDIGSVSCFLHWLLWERGNAVVNLLIHPGIRRWISSCLQVGRREKEGIYNDLSTVCVL